jgi:hypothetical protein
MSTRRVVMAASALALSLVGGVVTAATASAGPYCGITWGSLEKSSVHMTPAPITGARAGRHDCFDRLVIDLGGKPAPGYFVRYTDGFHAPGSGDPLAVKGGAVLSIQALAPAYDESGQSTVSWRVGQRVVRPKGFRTFRDVVYGGSFEGESALGLGVRARLPFRVFTLDGPGGGSRLVIDVAHRW